MTSEHDDCGISDVVCGVCRTARSEEADQDDPAETGDVLVRTCAYCHEPVPAGETYERHLHRRCYQKCYRAGTRDRSPRRPTGRPRKETK